VKVTTCGIDITGTIPEFELRDGGESIQIFSEVSQFLGQDVVQEIHEYKAGMLTIGSQCFVLYFNK
jgi:hypothetical protein